MVRDRASTSAQRRPAMKAVGYKKSLPIDAADALIDFEAPEPEPTGRDIRVAVMAISVNPADYKMRKRVEPPEGQIKILGYDVRPESWTPSVPRLRCSSQATRSSTLARSNAKVPIPSFIWSMS